MFKRYPDTEQFKNCVKQVREKATFVGIDPDGNVIRNPNAPMPKVKFVGTVKLHGSCAAIIARRGAEEIQCQSRENILSLLKDNAGFAMFINSVGHKRLSDYALGMFPEATEVCVYGEWCGGNVQKGVGISGLSKMFVVFGLLVDDVWQKPDIVKNFKLPEAQIFNIFDYRTFEIEIDFADPEPFRNTIVDWVLEVERECPVAKAFGNTGIGEGIVFKSYDEPWNESRFWFKAKGEKHSATKTKVLLPIDTEKHASVKAFAESVMTDSRYEQAVQAVKLELGRETLENGDFGKVLAWLNRDIVKEESDGIAACGATDFKEVVSHVARMARQKFFGGAS